MKEIDCGTYTKFVPENQYDKHKLTAAYPHLMPSEYICAMKPFAISATENKVKNSARLNVTWQEYVTKAIKTQFSKHS